MSRKGRKVKAAVKKAASTQKKVVKKANAKRPVDKWKKKKWYKMIAPKEFDNKVLTETVAEKPTQLEKRSIQVGLDELTGQRTKRSTVLTFETKDVQGQNINTYLKKYEVKQSFLNRLVRRRSSKVELVQTLPFGDRKTRIKTLLITQRKIERTKRTDIRKIIKEIIEEHSQKDTFEEFVNQIIQGKVQSKIFDKTKKIVPIKKIEITKASLLKK